MKQNLSFMEALTKHEDLAFNYKKVANHA